MRNQIGFAINGIVNNFVYVILLSAAEDILKGQYGPGLILAADIVPSMLVKAIFPYFIHKLSYGVRIIACSLLSICSMWIVAYAEQLWIRIVGVMIASFSSGLGEITFLSLSSFYHYTILSSWGTGTGLAGVFGSLIYLILTRWLDLSSHVTLAVLSWFPSLMTISYFIIIEKHHLNPYTTLSEEIEDESEIIQVVNNSTLRPRSQSPQKTLILQEDPVLFPHEMKWKDRLFLIKSLFKEMWPLFLVFFAEYTINQGVAPVLLFPLNSTPFKNLSDHYVYYQFIYQVGVLISRSSLRYLKIKNTLFMAWIQCCVLVFLILQAIFTFIHHVYWIFLIILLEGLLGGAVYVNGFHNITVTSNEKHKEFALAVASIADTFGICLASLVSIHLSPFLCSIQIQRGNHLCSK